MGFGVSCHLVVSQPGWGTPRSSAFSSSRLSALRPQGSQLVPSPSPWAVPLRCPCQGAQGEGLLPLKTTQACEGMMWVDRTNSGHSRRAQMQTGTLTSLRSRSRLHLSTASPGSQDLASQTQHPALNVWGAGAKCHPRHHRSVPPGSLQGLAKYP